MPKKLASSFKVKRGNDYITVGPYTHPQTGKKGWRFGYQVNPGPGKPWIRITRTTKDEARLEAEAVLEQRASGLVWSSLSPGRRRFHEAIERECPADDEDAVLAFIRARRKSTEITAAVACFRTFKETEAGELTPHMAIVCSTLETLAKAFAGKSVTDIHTPDLLSWWTDRCADVGPKRKKDIRSCLVTFWNWCKREGIAGNEAVTAAERLPTITIPKTDPAIVAPETFLRLAAAVEEQDRVTVVISYFAGLRPEEAAPPAYEKARKKTKRGLRREEIDWRFGCIRIPREVSKVNQPRVVPMSDACVAWLEWAGVREGQTGPLCPRNLSDCDETLRLGKEVYGGKWPKDALRHSYGSYRNAQLRNLDKVAEEMGTSVAMLHGSYHNPRAEEEGRAWADLRPPGAKWCDKSAIPQESPPGTTAANA